ncbi:uncharacterized protein LOC126779904 isoform X2 [Nymphalis io]|nr:uncharacterized protein LOC126779904 isoform X2 [Nymphalis io]
MSSSYDEGPVYYREIQKNAYLKRIPNDINSSKLRPLGHKKPPLKPMWTLFCVHNGKTPFLEQYPEADSAATLAHRPAWRACLRSARHVTASVKPHVGAEYDFLVDTDHGPVRMLAPDWESMQDWVSILRAKLHELRIVSRGENVYGAPPVAPPARAAARDPTSPLPPTPPVPPDRVPGIDLTPLTRPTLETNESVRENSTPTPQPPPTPQTSQTAQETPPTPTPLNQQEIPTSSAQAFPNTSSLTNVMSLTNIIPQETEVDISSWEPFSLPSTSREVDHKKGVAKICGQNICLDDSLFKRNVTDSDEEFFNEIDRINDNDSFDFKQRVVVNNGEHSDNGDSAPQRSNVTVIQVSNKGPPHTAIPVLGPETDVFDFEFKQNLRITPKENKSNFVNIVNTETPSDSSYGTVFDNSNSEYGHISLTTTVSLTGQDVRPAVSADVNVTAVNGDGNVTVNSDGIYERLCLASTANVTASPLSVRRVRAEKVRKSSLPNLDHVESDYECLFPNSSQSGNTVSENATSSMQNGRLNDVSRNMDTVQRVIRSNVERSQSQNAYDIAPRQSARRVTNSSPKREAKIEKPEQTQSKPIWKRGLTELSLLSRLRGIAQIKRQESPTRNDEEQPVTSPAKVVHRSRPVGRVDSLRRRSNSLTNCVVPTAPSLQPLRARQAAALRAEQRRGACVATAVLTRDAPLLCEYERQV